MAPTSRCLPLHLPHPHRILPACHTCYSPPPPYNFGPAALPVHSTRSVSLSHLALHFLLYSSSVMTSHESRFPWILPLLNSSMSLGHAFPHVLVVYVIMDFYVIQTLRLCANTSHTVRRAPLRTERTFFRRFERNVLSATGDSSTLEHDEEPKAFPSGFCSVFPTPSMLNNMERLAKAMLSMPEGRVSANIPQNVDLGPSRRHGLQFYPVAAILSRT
jgi:hypothetical protein